MEISLMSDRNVMKFSSFSLESLLQMYKESGIYLTCEDGQPRRLGVEW